MSKLYGPNTTVTFSVDTGYVGSTREEELTLEELGLVEEGETVTAEELDEMLEEVYETWLYENINCHFSVEEG
ncbi:hypothetical protein Goe24_01560 [Bacillus phage vB_BsuM-Goe24]|uniref:DUF7167 domain-containing protein n=1 Tax=Bacillus phage vB_BsuM-Goe3 TaxID=1933063 RepID=A0A1Z1D9Z0_BPGO3|nr:hypothetical protein HWB07_gp155 [Bacillus phage vB_BsuM-Goe3]APZ82615.1 hypothetical protein Goe3_c15400 [Bacillus phage vB_BsuM-Goe3]QDP43181.1 hypothetical protein Goe7_c01560 [Bacillus phage vB_BveM-Goe7]WCS69531.1 hypothetical protein Goe24_01560 [Bacillus phage vB_BsuM-Goe24]